MARQTHLGSTAPPLPLAPHLADGACQRIFFRGRRYAQGLDDSLDDALDGLSRHR